MTHVENRLVREKLEGLRTELVDLAFTLECRGRLDAADTAIMISARVREVCEELATAKPLPVMDHCR
jgi:hypothetical protein